MSARPDALTKRAMSLQARIEELDQRLRGTEQLADLQDRSRRLAVELRRAQQARDCLARFARRGLRPAAQLGVEEIARARESVLALQAAFARDRPSIPGEGFKDALRLVQAATTILEERARFVWRELHDRQTAAWSADFLGALDRLQPFRASVKAVRDSQARLHVLARQFPPTDADLDAFFIAASTRSQAFAQLEGQQGIPAPIVVFLTQSASSAGFPLEGVTPEIEEWLRAQGILASFRVKL